MCTAPHCWTLILATSIQKTSSYPLYLKPTLLLNFHSHFGPQSCVFLVSLLPYSLPHIVCLFQRNARILTSWCRVLLEKLTGLQLVKKFPAFHGTRRFITALTSVRQLSLSWASPVQSIYPHPTSWRSILILSTHLRLGLPSGSFPPHI